MDKNYRLYGIERTTDQLIVNFIHSHTSEKHEVV